MADDDIRELDKTLRGRKPRREREIDRTSPEYRAGVIAGKVIAVIFLLAVTGYTAYLLARLFRWSWSIRSE